MADLELLKQLRAAGVKSATIDNFDKVTSVEFFPRSLLDLPGIDEAVDPLEAPTEPPPSADDHQKVPPAMARVLGRKSVS